MQRLSQSVGSILQTGLETVRTIQNFELTASDLEQCGEAVFGLTGATSVFFIKSNTRFTGIFDQLRAKSNSFKCPL